jgi:hypothetical protein
MGGYSPAQRAVADAGTGGNPGSLLNKILKLTPDEWRGLEQKDRDHAQHLLDAIAKRNPDTDTGREAQSLLHRTGLVFGVPDSLRQGESAKVPFDFPKSQGKTVPSPLIGTGSMRARVETYAGRKLKVERDPREWGTLRTFINGRPAGSPYGSDAAALDKALIQLRRDVDGADERRAMDGDTEAYSPEYYQGAPALTPLQQAWGEQRRAREAADRAAISAPDPTPIQWVDARTGAIVSNPGQVDIVRGNVVKADSEKGRAAVERRQASHAVTRNANLKIRAQARADELRESRNPKDNAAKVKAIQDGTLHSADLYRTIMSGPSGQKSHVFVGRVRYTPDNRSGEFEVIDTNSGERAGWMTRTVRNGEQVYVLHAEDYDGGIRLVGWTDTVSYGADVLVNGESRASTRGTLDARRLSGGKFEPYVPKSLEQFDQEREERDRAAKELRQQQREALDTPRAKRDDGGMTVTETAAEGRQARINANVQSGALNKSLGIDPETVARRTGTPRSVLGDTSIGVTTSSKGRTTTVTLPDGTVAERTSKTRTYTHAVVATRDLHQRAQLLQAENDRRQAFVDALQAWVDRGANTDELKAYPSGSLSYNDQRAGKSRNQYYLPGFEPVRESVRGGRDYWADHFGFSLPNFKDTTREVSYNRETGRLDGPEMTSWEQYGPSHVLGQQRSQIAGNREQITKLNAGPRYVYEVIRWSGSRANAQKAAGSEFASPGTTYRVIGVGDDISGQTADESKPIKAGPTAEERKAAQVERAAAEKARVAKSNEEWTARKVADIRRHVAEDNQAAVRIDVGTTNDKGLRAIARAFGIKSTPRGMAEYQKTEWLRNAILEAARK